MYVVQIQQEDTIISISVLRQQPNRTFIFIISGRNYYFEDEVIARIEQLLRIRICCNQYCNPEQRYEVRRNIFYHIIMESYQPIIYHLSYIYIIYIVLSTIIYYSIYSIFLSIYPSIYLFIYLSIYTYLSINLSF